MQRHLIRLRQIRALYQRELTSLNRDPNIDDATRRQRAEALWQQATDQIARIRLMAEADLTSLADDERALFDPPKRPAYLDLPE